MEWKYETKVSVKILDKDSYSKSMYVFTIYTFFYNLNKITSLQFDFCTLLVFIYAEMLLQMTPFDLPFNTYVYESMIFFSF